MIMELNNKWWFWYHSINDNKWTKESYKKIYECQNIYDYHYMTETFKQEHYQNGMFFIMKEDIFPNWEDPYNRNGGCISFKIPSKDIINEWNNLLLMTITENLFKTHDEINGISISPKKEFNIIKIWIKNDGFDYKKELKNISENVCLDNTLYKKHEIS
jgi:hypothetical protein